MSDLDPSQPPFVTGADMALLTDLYELTMASSYFTHGMNTRVTFELSIRSLPAERNFLVVAGIADALAYLETVRFTASAIDYLASTGLFASSFLEYLTTFRFTGEAWAMTEGEIAFGAEPLMRITAPLIEAQLVETFLMNCISFQTMVASKAARLAIASQGRPFVDFSPRRDHGADAALKGARAAFIGGAVGTSNVLAGRIYGLPLSGTMAHSYVMSFDHEADAFRQYAEDFPEQATLLIDTFDTLQGARHAAVVGREMAARGRQLHGVRLDSGDLHALSRAVREILDGAGLETTQIFASGDLDEYRIASLLASGAPIDAFGVGTQLGTSADAPSLGAIYKLVEDERGPRMKRSAGKATLPGVKQVHRIERAGRFDHDVIALASEDAVQGQGLLAMALRDGRRIDAAEPLLAIRERCAANLAKLPGPLREIEGEQARYPVELSEALERLVRLVQSDPADGSA